MKLSEVKDGDKFAYSGIRWVRLNVRGNGRVRCWGLSMIDGKPLDDTREVELRPDLEVEPVA